jgi:hypothetical protein
MKTCSRLLNTESEFGSFLEEKMSNHLRLIGWLLISVFGLSVWLAAKPVAAVVKGNPLDETAALWPKDAVSTALVHWKELEELKKKHRDAIKELDRVVTGGEKLTPKVAEEVSLARQLLEADLALDPGPEEGQVFCRRTIERLDRLKDGDRTRADTLLLSSARLELEIKMQLQKAPARTPEEVRALVEQAEATLQTYREVHMKYNMGVRGGEADKEALTGFLVCSRIAVLLEAIGDRDGAIKRCKQACEYAEEGVQATRAAYDAGTVTLDLLLGAQHRRAESWLALAKLDSAVAEQLRRDMRK